MSPASGNLPTPLLHGVETALRTALGERVRIEGMRGLGGGSIHRALRLETSTGQFFMKWNRGDDALGFPAEARGLEALRAGANRDGMIRVPRVVSAVSPPDEAEAGGHGWIILEYLPPSPSASSYAHRLGEGLALLHRSAAEEAQGRFRAEDENEAPAREARSDEAAESHAGESPLAASVGGRVRGGIPTSGSVHTSHPEAGGAAFGWEEDNFIGPLLQANRPTADWSTFWRDRRLRPQIEAAVASGELTGPDLSWVDPLLDAVEPALAGVDLDAPHLIHGDLWAGNVHPGPDGRPVLVDPAVYRGHGEVDLAMAQLFGGFDRQAFRSYAEIIQVDEGFAAVRRPLYQLYYLLVHLRLFGASYLSSTRAAANTVIQAVN